MEGLVGEPILGCAEKGGCRVPRHKPSVTYPLKRQPVTYPLPCSLHVFRRTKIFGYVAKTSLCYIPYVTGYVMGVGHGPCYKPIVLARAHVMQVPAEEAYIHIYIHIYISHIAPSRNSFTHTLRLRPYDLQVRLAQPNKSW